MHVEGGHVGVDLLREFLLGEIRVVEPEVEGPSVHGLGVGQNVQETIGHIADVDVVALEVLFEEAIAEPIPEI